MTLLTPQKDGRHITELYINNGPNVAHHVALAAPYEGWADLLVYDENGRPVYNLLTERPLTRRVKGEISFVDTRDGR